MESEFEENYGGYFDRCDSSFPEFTTPPTLFTPGWDREFRLYSDASGYQLAGILWQRDGNGEERVISYANRTMQAEERKWGVSEQKMAALIFATGTSEPSENSAQDKTAANDETAVQDKTSAQDEVPESPEDATLTPPLFLTSDSDMAPTLNHQ